MIVKFKNVFSSMLKLNGLFISFFAPLCFSVLTYLYDWPLIFVFLVFLFFLALEFVARLFYVSQDIQPPGFFGAYEIPKTSQARIISASLATLWYGSIMFFVFHDQIYNWIIAVLTFGILKYFIDEHRARNPKF